MSKRMTQERLTWFRLQRATLDAQGLRTEDHVKELHDEVERARASEKALADALMTASPRRLKDGSACWCFGIEPHEEACEMKRKALRLAGGLP